MKSHWTTIWSSSCRLRYTWNSRWQVDIGFRIKSQLALASNLRDVEIKIVPKMVLKSKPDQKICKASEFMRVQLLMSTGIVNLSCLEIFVQVSVLLDLYLKKIMTWYLLIVSGGLSKILVHRFLSGSSFSRTLLLSLLRYLKVERFPVSSAQLMQPVQSLATLTLMSVY